MKLSERYFIINTLKVFDLSAMVVAFVVAALVPFVDFAETPTFSTFLAMRVKLTNILLFLGFLLLWNIVFRGFGLYSQERAARGGRTELLDISKATAGGALIMWAGARTIGVELMTFSWLVVFWALACTASISGRVTLRAFLQWRQRSHIALSHLLVVGTNQRAVALVNRIKSHPELGYRLIGFVDERWDGEEAFLQSGYPVVCDFAGFQDYLKDHVVDEVIICTPVKSHYDRAYGIVKQCEQEGVTVRSLSDLFTATIGRSAVENFEEHAVFTVNISRMSGPSVMIKRLFDICVSLLMLITLLPLFAVIAVIIKVTSRGAVFFIQERIGLNKRHFRLYKFRTMVVDAEQRLAMLERDNEVSGPVFKIKHDPRVTPLGAFLRKSSLDELPQLLNVLKGDMSLVGPRPLPIRDYRGFTQDWHRRRFSVRPGITCLWQVAGRSEIPFDRWMELDMEYIDQWSLMLDLKILLRTIPSVLKGSGAS